MFLCVCIFGFGGNSMHSDLFKMVDGKIAKYFMCNWFRRLYYVNLQREEKGKMKHKAFYFFY